MNPAIRFEDFVLEKCMQRIFVTLLFNNKKINIFLMGEFMVHIQSIYYKVDKNEVHIGTENRLTTVRGWGV